MQGRIAQFVVGAVLLAAVQFVPAALVGGTDWLGVGLTAFGLTFVPALATMVAAGLTFRAAPDMLLLAGLGGSAVRLAASLGGGLALAVAYPDPFGPAFLLWLAIFYLLLLALEITLLVRERPTDKGTTI